MLTRNEYNASAAIIKRVAGENKHLRANSPSRIASEYAAKQMIELIQAISDNPRFDKERFIAACTPE